MATRTAGPPLSVGRVRSSRGPSRDAIQAIYGTARLDAWRAQNRCPENDRLCAEAVWLTQSMLLGPRRDMDEIAEAVRKVQASASELARGEQADAR